MPRAKQRTEDLRERGLAGALAVLDEEGVAGLTTRAVAGRANASLPAVYEVFGDKAGIVREVFFHGFHLLAEELSALPETTDPLAGVRQVAEAFRRFIVGNPVLAEIMFARPFADFDPTAEETKAGVRVRKVFTRCVREAVDAGLLAGDPTDIALVLFVYAEGMAKAENAHRLGGARPAIDRRWRLGLNALLAGFSGASRSATG